MKHCKKCGTDRPLQGFSKSNQTKDGHTYTCKYCYKEWRLKNKVHLKEYIKKWYQENIDIQREKNRINASNDKEGMLRRSKKWRENNKEKKKESARNWSKRNKYYGAYRAAKRRAVILRATPKWADHEKIKSIYAEANLTGKHVDHIYPLVSDFLCGLHVENNLQLLTPEENRKKSNKTWPSDYNAA